MPEPKDKLDTSVNGPAGLYPVFDGDAWENVDWLRREEEVRRLRSRIFKAVREGDWPLVLDFRGYAARSSQARRMTRISSGVGWSGRDALYLAAMMTRRSLAAMSAVEGWVLLAYQGARAR